MKTTPFYRKSVNFFLTTEKPVHKVRVRLACELKQRQSSLNFFYSAGTDIILSTLQKTKAPIRLCGRPG